MDRSGRERAQSHPYSFQVLGVHTLTAARVALQLSLQVALGDLDRLGDSGQRQPEVEQIWDVGCSSGASGFQL